MEERTEQLVAIAMENIKQTLHLMLLHRSKYHENVYFTEDGWAQGVIQNACQSGELRESNGRASKATT